VLPKAAAPAHEPARPQAPAPARGEAEPPAAPRRKPETPPSAAAPTVEEAAGWREESLVWAEFRPLLADRPWPGLRPPAEEAEGPPGFAVEASGPAPQVGASIFSEAGTSGPEAPTLVMAKAAPGRPQAASRQAEVAGHIEASQGGRIPSGLRRPMEALFGRRFGQVRLHTDDAAARAADSLGAEAFTVGRRIYFGQGRFRPTSEGAALLGHELTHVVQAAPALAPKSALGDTAAPLRLKTAGSPPPARPLPLARLPQDSPPLRSLERQAEESEAAVREVFEGPAAPMVLRKAQAGAAQPALPEALWPGGPPSGEAAGAPLQLAPDLPTARIVQASADASAPAAAAAQPAAGEEGKSAAADVHRLAEEVYRLIKSKLRTERERMGLR
jgi:hypothetical protein